MIAGRKYWSKEKEKYFKEELVMTKEDNKDFKIPTKCWICGNNYVDNNVRRRNHCHITRIT